MKIDKYGFIHCAYCPNKIHRLEPKEILEKWKLTPVHKFVICPSCLLRGK